jgi:hypothetical protein
MPENPGGILQNTKRFLICFPFPQDSSLGLYRLMLSFPGEDGSQFLKAQEVMGPSYSSFGIKISRQACFSPHVSFIFPMCLLK